MIYKSLFFLFLSAKLSADFLLIGDYAEGRHGMFAAANKILGEICLYEKGSIPNATGLKVDFEEYGFYYDALHGKNWWEYYFEPIVIGLQGNSELRKLTKAEGFKAWEVRRKMTHNEINTLVRKYVRPLPWVQKKVDQFVKENFEGFYVIGVHYRGTDKSSEAPRVDYKEMFEKIQEYIPIHSLYKIFVATDEASFLQAILEEFPNQVLATDAYRSEGKKGIHFSDSPSFEMGEQAVIDSLLLSRSNLLIRTSSNLSLWSSYFNPSLPVILLNQRYLKTLNPE